MTTNETPTISTEAEVAPVTVTFDAAGNPIPTEVVGYVQDGEGEVATTVTVH